MHEIRKSEPKSLTELTCQWDQLAETRDRQLTEGIDVSFKHVIAPAALRLLDGEDLSLLLDVGCGVGHFTNLISERAKTVIGVEPSTISITIAKRVCANRRNVEFINTSIENLPPPLQLGTAAVALMVMMTAPDLDSFVKSLSRLLRVGGAFIGVIPHPCFWPSYWGYASASWFNYSTETFIEAPFSISNDRTSVLTTHIHRPLEKYLSIFSQSGFRLVVMEELMPDSNIQAMYPEPWRYPRFMALKWTKIG